MTTIKKVILKLNMVIYHFINACKDTLTIDKYKI